MKIVCGGTIKIRRPEHHLHNRFISQIVFVGTSSSAGLRDVTVQGSFLGAYSAGIIEIGWFQV